MQNKIHRPGLLFRLLIIIYDLLPLAGLVFACHAVLFLIRLILPENINGSLLINGIHFSLLIGVIYLFYVWFWVNGGQTLGMRAWHLYLVDYDGKFLSWKTASIRFFAAIISTACLGMGFAWILVNKKKMTWHDYISKSQVVRQNQ